MRRDWRRQKIQDRIDALHSAREAQADVVLPNPLLIHLFVPGLDGPRAGHRHVLRLQGFAVLRHAEPSRAAARGAARAGRSSSTALRCSRAEQSGESGRSASAAGRPHQAGQAGTPAGRTRLPEAGTPAGNRAAGGPPCAAPVRGPLVAAGPRRRYARDAACACGCGMIHSCSVTGGTRPEDGPARRPVAGIQLPGGGRPALLREERGAALHVRAACVRRIPAVAHRAAASSRWLACRGDGTRSEQEMARRRPLDGAKQNAPAFPEREYPGRKTRLRGWVVRRAACARRNGPDVLSHHSSHRQRGGCRTRRGVASGSRHRAWRFAVIKARRK